MKIKDVQDAINARLDGMAEAVERKDGPQKIHQD